jgi:hypothetical protein
MIVILSQAELGLLSVVAIVIYALLIGALGESGGLTLYELEDLIITLGSNIYFFCLLQYLL